LRLSNHIIQLCTYYTYSL